MKILAHDPRRNDRLEHLTEQVDGAWTALCQPGLCEGDTTSKGTWVVRDKDDKDFICSTCAAKQEKLDNPPESTPPLPCTDPGKLVTLWTRQGDERAQVHSCVNLKSEKSRCGVGNPSYTPDRWTTQAAQPASKITCSLCMKAEKLWPDWPPHKHRKKHVSRDIHESPEERDTRLWNAWHTGGKNEH